MRGPPAGALRGWMVGGGKVLGPASVTVLDPGLGPDPGAAVQVRR